MNAQPSLAPVLDNASIHAALAAALASALVTGLAAGLAAQPLRPERTAAVRSSVLGRVRQSAQEHRSFFTVRHEDRPWALAEPGAQQQFIGQADGLRSDVWQLAPGAPLPWLEESRAHEVLVLEGALSLLSPDAPAQVWPALHHAVRGRPATQGSALRAGPLGARVYTRNTVLDTDQLSPREAAWWAAGLAEPLAAGLSAPNWIPFSAGVDAAWLHGVGDVASMLIRLAPGATLPNHGHSMNEDCFMLEGHMFLGDILMRAGDYQRAPVGCEHAGICSDTGGLFYFHGALPAAASDAQT